MKRLLTLLCALLLVTSLSAQRSQRIAVFEFVPGANISQEMVTGISSIFTTYFTPNGWSCVDRTEIDQIVSEQNFQQSKITESQRTKIGRVHNISKMVLGTINIANGQYNVDVRVVDVTTGEISATEGISIPAQSDYRTAIKTLARNLAKKVEALPVIESEVRDRADVEIVMNYLKVYPEELGKYSYEPTTIIKQINLQHRYDYDTWRIPTTEELDLLRNNGYLDDEKTYISSSSSSSEGILLLVTDATETYSEKQARLAQEAEARNAQKRHPKTEPTFVNDTYTEVATTESTGTKTLREIFNIKDKRFTIMGDLDFAFGDGLILGSPFVMAGTTLNDRVFLGAGTGFIVDYENDFDLPIYFNTRVYFTKNTFVRPFITASIGAELIDMGIYFNPAVGVEIPYSDKVDIYLSAGLELKEDYYDDGYDYYYGPISLFSIKLGLVF